MTFKVFVTETLERSFLIEAESQQAAKDIFENTPIGDLEEDDYEVIERLASDPCQQKEVEA